MDKPNRRQAMTRSVHGFKAFEKAGWENRASTYTSRTEHITGALMPTILDHADIQSGQEVLELACGPGYGAAAMARVGAHVTGTDFADAMVEEARRRNPRLTFEAADAEALPYPDASFDRVLCCFGVLHFANPDQAFAEVARVLRPQGRFTFTVWGAVDKAPFFSAVPCMVRQFGTLDVDLPPGPPVDRFSDSEEACRSLAEHHLEMDAFIEDDYSAPMGPAAEMPRVYREMAVRTQGLLDAQPAQQLPRVEAGLVRFFEFYEQEGVVVLPFPYCIVSAVLNTID